jgi:hypothetical protein
LTTLNDPTWNEAARVLAAKLIRTEADQSARLDRIYELVLSRRPTEPERKVLLRILDQQRAEFASDKAAAKKTISIGAAPREDKLDPVELASWTEMCLAVYNLDEALTRE